MPEQEKYDEISEEFIKIKKTTLKLEHSLLSIKKWESKWHKPYLGNDDKSIPEILDYISCMTLNKESVNPMVYRFLNEEDVKKIIDYIKDPMTATWFSGNNRIGASNKYGEVVTAEIIYYWMISLQVPVEFEKWHLNQLLTLLKVISIKNGGEKKMSKKDAAIQRKMLNEQRRKKYKTKG